MNTFAHRILENHTAPQDDADRRSAHLDFFRTQGLPTPKNEAWTFTSLAPLRNAAWAFTPSVARAASPTSDAHLAWHNGTLVSQHLPQGFKLLSYDEAQQDAAFSTLLARSYQAEDNSLAALTRGLGQAVFLKVSTAADARHFFNLQYTVDAEESAAFPLLFIAVEAGAKATLTQTFTSTVPAWVNPLTALHLGTQAEVHFMRLQHEHTGVIHTAEQTILLSEEARFEHYACDIGAHLSRMTMKADSLGDRTHFGMHTIAMARGNQHADTTCIVNHNHLYGTSNIQAKNIAVERGHTVFQGKFYVAPGAQKTDAEMLSKSLLLSDRARADSKPELDIFADDVKCAHGATTGSLDEEALFYLQSRGVLRREAMQMLIQGFIHDILESVPDAAITEAWQNLCDAWFEQVISVEEAHSEDERA